MSIMYFLRLYSTEDLDNRWIFRIVSSIGNAFLITIFLDHVDTGGKILSTTISLDWCSEPFPGRY